MPLISNYGCILPCSLTREQCMCACEWCWSFAGNSEQIKSDLKQWISTINFESSMDVSWWWYVCNRTCFGTVGANNLIPCKILLKISVKYPLSLPPVQLKMWSVSFLLKPPPATAPFTLWTLPVDLYIKINYFFCKLPFIMQQNVTNTTFQSLALTIFLSLPPPPKFCNVTWGLRTGAEVCYKFLFCLGMSTPQSLILCIDNQLWFSVATFVDHRKKLLSWGVRAAI